MNYLLAILAPSDNTIPSVWAPCFSSLVLTSKYYISTVVVALSVGSLVGLDEQRPFSFCYIVDLLSPLYSSSSLILGSDRVDCTIAYSCMVMDLDYAYEFRCLLVLSLTTIFVYKVALILGVADHRRLTRSGCLPGLPPRRRRPVFHLLTHPNTRPWGLAYSCILNLLAFVPHYMF
jgi:hypothetical protein